MVLTNSRIVGGGVSRRRGWCRLDGALAGLDASLGTLPGVAMRVVRDFPIIELPLALALRNGPGYGGSGHGGGCGPLFSSGLYISESPSN